MKKLLTLLLITLFSLTTFSQTLKQFPKGGENAFGYNVVTPTGYDAKKKYPVIFFIHGIGEASDGSLPKLTNVYNWVKNNSFLLKGAEKYGFILVIPTYLNTTDEKSRVCKWILERIKSTYLIDEKIVAFVGHSNGSHTLGTWAFADPEFAKQVSVWAASASGPFSTAATFKNVADYDVRVWGITSVNDAVTSTMNTQQLASKVPALNPNATVIITKIPASRFPDGAAAHNLVLGQLTQTPVPFVSLGNITDRLGSTPRMDLYQFILSNPKGSIPQLPDHAYTGPKWPEVVVKPEPPKEQPEPPQPERKFIGYNIYGENIKIEPVFSDGSLPAIKGTNGDEIKVVWIPASAMQKPTTTGTKSGKKMQVVK